MLTGEYDQLEAERLRLSKSLDTEDVDRLPGAERKAEVARRKLEQQRAVVHDATQAVTVAERDALAAVNASYQREFDDGVAEFEAAAQALIEAHDRLIETKNAWSKAIYPHTGERANPTVPGIPALVTRVREWLRNRPKPLT